MEVIKLSGKYVLAVSGGVDSVVLLDLLAKQQNLTLIVAHFDHGIRPDSVKDRLLVGRLVADYGYKFSYQEGHLGSQASEQMAREARYEFLNDLVKKEVADGLITAHHQDDLIETAIINMIRGSGRKGLSALAANPKIIRPLLKYSKKDIVGYAQAHKLKWCEDPSNQDTKYLRNYIRLNIVPKINESKRQQLIDIIYKQLELNEQIDRHLAELLKQNLDNDSMPRSWLNTLDHKLSAEILAAWLRQNGIRDFDRQTLNRLSSHLKTVQPGKTIDILKGWQIASTRDNLALEHLER